MTCLVVQLTMALWSPREIGIQPRLRWMEKMSCDCISSVHLGVQKRWKTWKCRTWKWRTNKQNRKMEVKCN